MSQYVKVETYKTPIKRYSPKLMEARLGVSSSSFDPKTNELKHINLNLNIEESRTFVMMLDYEQTQRLIEELKSSLENAVKFTLREGKNE